LHIPAEIEYLHILISDIRKLNYSVAYFADFYCLLIEQNLKLKLYHPDLFGRLIFQQWYDVVRLKSESNALLLLFKKPIFKWKYITFKQVRKTFKLSLKY